MQSLIRLFALVASSMLLMHAAAAQNHLKLKSKANLEDKYAVYLRKVFNRIYRGDVVLSTLCIPSFSPEGAAGILKTPRGYEAFSLSISASVWATEYHSIIRSFDEHNREIRWKPDDNLRKGLPISYRDIKTGMRSRPVSTELAERIRRLWQAKLIDALHPPTKSTEPKDADRYVVTDGVSYDYSMPLQGRGLVTAEGQLILENTSVWLMGELSEVLAAYARGNTTESDLMKVLKRAER